MRSLHNTLVRLILWCSTGPLSASVFGAMNTGALKCPHVRFIMSPRSNDSRKTECMINWPEHQQVQRSIALEEGHTEVSVWPFSWNPTLRNIGFTIFKRTTIFKLYTAMEGSMSIEHTPFWCLSKNTQTWLKLGNGTLLHPACPQCNINFCL